MKCLWRKACWEAIAFTFTAHPVCSLTPFFMNGSAEARFHWPLCVQSEPRLMTTQGARAATASEHYRLQLLTKARPHRLPLLIRTQTDNTPIPPHTYTHTNLSLSSAALSTVVCIVALHS